MRDTVNAEMMDTATLMDVVGVLGGRGYGRAGNLAAKRGMDLTLALMMIVIASPVMLALWLLVRLDGGPGLFGHTRIGHGGREFRCLKFRSMVTDAKETLASHLAEDPAAAREWERSQKLTNDPRITPLGRLLRATSLDEIPQLFNVLSGDMSLVGPRPVVRSELTRFYGPQGCSAYLSVKPGITGLWQVSGRSDLSYDSRVALDTQYAQNVSILQDLRILFRTVTVVLSRDGAC